MGPVLISRRRSGVIAAVTATIAFAAVLTGCGTLDRAATATAPAVAHTAQLTGAQLAAALVPGSAFPRGYLYDSSTSFNSGKRMETGQVKYKLASVSCGDFGLNFGQAGFGESAVAGDSYSTLIGNYTATSGGAYDQTVYQFTSTSAAGSWWRALRSLLVRCPGLGLAKMLGSGGSLTQRFSAVQVPGAQAFRLDVAGVAKMPGFTMATRVQTWMAVSGQDVFDVDALGDGREVPGNPAPETLLRALIARVLAADGRPVAAS